MKYSMFVLIFSGKSIKSLSKSGGSPFFLGDNKNPIFRYIYDLLNDGIKGVTKKDVVSTILADISVSKSTINTQQILN